MVRNALNIIEENERESKRSFKPKKKINKNIRESSKELNKKSDEKKDEKKNEKNIKCENFKMIFQCYSFKKKIFFDIDEKYYDKNLIISYLIILLISLHTFYFLNAYLFSDKYISERNSYKNQSEIVHILVKEFDKFIIIYFLFLYLIKIFF